MPESGTDSVRLKALSKPQGPVEALPAPEGSAATDAAVEDEIGSAGHGR